MIDFIEYVVAELKSKRLSKTDAVALVKQFSFRASSSAAGAAIHPLLHRNVSDLSEQRYRSTFKGEEFFLADHQVNPDGKAAYKVLPGVAYLEMARAAIEHALPEWPESAVLELRNTVWAAPIIVAATKEVSLALIASDDDAIDFEFYSEDAGQDVVHCQGRAILSRPATVAPVDVEQLERQMGQDQVEPSDLYAACARMGLLYGPSFQGIVGIRRGSEQVFADLRLPKSVEGTSGEYVLHPSLMDSALQASVGLLGGWSEIPNEPRLPFALELLRVVSPCTREMKAWVRYSPGSQATGNVIKLDIDLCDERGNVCVQMHGLSWRALRKEAHPVAVQGAGEGVMAPVDVEPSVRAAEVSAETLPERTQAYLRRQLSGLLKVPSHKIDPRAPLENYGIDSILAMKLTNQLEQKFGSLSKTLFFEYRTIQELADYFVANHFAELTVLLAPAGSRDREAVLPASPDLPAAPTARTLGRRSNRRRSTAAGPAMAAEPIAIVGLSGRYPEARDLEAYWQNLREGKDCITEVPAERWDWREYYSEDRTQNGHHYSKWGGFIAGADEFDPLFFNISPIEAELMDPQERLFLQHAWMAIEDAGYTRAGLQSAHAQDLPGQAGVYVGLMYSEYQLLAAEASARGKRMGIAGSPASIANRVSYILNLHGPSMTLDSMCSSSLTAIHVASQDLKLGRIDLAIAGGVNLSIHPNKYLVLSGGQFISSDGHCQSFGKGGDGYIPGEGVGVVVLKRLSDATKDGDHIYGVIRGSAINHGGKTNGYTVPSPQAQTSVVRRALVESRIDARHISYIEAHGTGTKLGDPIEIAALSKAFHQFTQDTEFCLIGSAKSNIGHCESAAGIAGLTKVLLQMQHRQIVPSLHSAELNPHIDFSGSPFVVNQELRPWEPPVIDGQVVPRIAGISSFGAGGSNAHLVIEEYQPPMQEAAAPATVVILLSARTTEQLLQKALDLVGFVRARQDTINLAAVAHTLQVGREAMAERLGFVVSSIEQLLEKLDAYVAGEQEIEDAYQGRVKGNDDALSLFSNDADLQQTIDKWVVNGKLSKLLDLWVKGLELDWSKLYREARPRRISLPAYPFAREHYWVDVTAGGQVAGRSGTLAVLHPLVHSNTSDLSEQRFHSTFTGDEFFLTDHRVQAGGGEARKMLPGVAYLEMARAAVEHALPDGPESTVLELRNVVWAAPIVVHGQTQVDIALAANDENQIDFEVYSLHDEEEIVHCQGRAVVGPRPEPIRLDLEQLQAQMDQGAMEPGSVYAACARMGLIYGPAFQGITAIHRGNDQVLARLTIPKTVEGTSAFYVLHPSLMDSAIQACLGLIDGSSERTDQVRLPFALESVRIASPCTAQMVAWVRYSPGSQADDAVVKVDIDLCDEHGNLCVQMQGLSSRVLSKEIHVAAAADQAIGSLLATPVWQTTGIEAVDSGKREFAEHQVVLCELAQVDVTALESLIPGIRCVSLQASEQGTIAQRYIDDALACFERIQAILQSKPRGKVLFHIVVADHQEQALLAGLSGLLKTAALENPHVAGQVLLVPAHMKAEELALLLRGEKTRGLDTLVRYEQGVRQVLRWQDVPADAGAASIAFNDPGVYLITGGLGGLGILFAKEILAQTRETRVILTGRSAWSAETEALMDRLFASADRVTYRQVDLLDLEQVRLLFAEVRNEYQQLNGVLHCAGMISDHFILKKTGAEFRQVLAPKVMGTFNLDQASQDVELEFLVLFSSLAGALGNLGQADYATANAFMDQFAAYRNRQVAAGQRTGRTRSINWPLWQDGGMGIDPASQELLQQTTGMQPMQTATGMRAFYRSLALPYDQTLVVEGDLAQMRRALMAGRPMPPESPLPANRTQPVAADRNATVNESERLVERTRDYLRKEFSELLKLPSHRIDPDAALETYGIDSILAMKLTNQLEQTFGSLSKTLFFEYQTIAALAGYLVKAHPAIVLEKIGGSNETAVSRSVAAAATVEKRPTAARRGRNRRARAGALKEIAIVGLAGRYPQAETLQEFWRNLQDGRDCVTEIPPERWDPELYYDPDPNKAGKSYSKWGGFISGVDRFDPLFFRISPKEAALMDPQERLFLETAWQTIEDAGYTRKSIAGSRVGVFVGVMWGQYELFGAESLLNGDAGLPTSSYASIANRVSYFFDFHGPSIALDTMCSSSLTAIHLACEEIRRGEIDAAIAGGVNVSIHPYKYVSLSQGKFVASDGKCRSFGEGGDGYVPGEGVGAVLLKPLDDALRDGDQIYAVIKSSTVNHGGKTNGYTVPNPNAQADLILGALKKAGVDPKTLGYVETHGTGTSLGDPIEITGLSKAFEGFTAEKQFCPIGSVKSNIGHLESAAGIAALTKALLQIKYEQLVPSLHADPLNPKIDFENSPFYVQTQLTEWKRPSAHPRRVAVSSFGAGGSNAHLILEEHAGVREPAIASQPLVPEAFVLSAMDSEALLRYAEAVVTFLRNAPDLSLAELAHTSQVGRTPMSVRLVTVASSVHELRARLTEWVALRKSGEPRDLENVFYGDVRDASYNAGNLIEGPAGKAFLEDLLENRDLEKIARLWVMNVEIDWSLLHRSARPRRVSLPTYPFAKERCWIKQGTASPRAATTIMRDVVGATPAEEKRRTYYTPQWTVNALGAREEERTATGSILILDGSDGLFRTMNEEMANRQGSDSIVLVKPGKSFQEVEPNVYTLDPEREEHVHELVETLEKQGRSPRLVLHHEAEPCSLDVEEEVARQQQRGIYTLLHLCQALMKKTHQVPLRFMSVFSSVEGSTAPLSAAMSGFFKTLTLENPRYLAKVVELQRAPGTDGELALAAKAALIREELLDGDWTTQEIRYRRAADDDQPYVRSVRSLVPDVRSEGASATTPLRQNGVYLITGGLGGLGFIFAEYLAKNLQAKLVLIGRSAPSALQEEKLSRLTGYGAEVLVLQADVARLADVEMVVREAKKRFAQIHGVIHAAGVNRDAFILKKTREEMDAVLAPKVQGAINVDLATRGESMDWLVLFSSVAGAMGNPGQSDYAYANQFLDSFAEYREDLRRAHERSGRTLSIDWPLWQEGGMGLSREGIDLLERRAGMSPLPTKDGLAYWEDFLRSDATQGVALYGIPSRIAAYLERRPVNARAKAAPPADSLDAGALFARTELYLKELIGEEIQLAPDRIGSSDPLESFGLDSVMINRINVKFEQDLGALPKTLLYENETVRALATFLVRESREALIVRLGSGDSTGEPALPAIRVEDDTRREDVPSTEERDDLEAIAIIGIHGYFPHAANLDEYWDNLKHGRDSIDLVPSDRWDYKEFFDPDPAAAADGRIYAKWGGFLDDYDKFDPRFFHISTEEAKIIDPQERLFLESVSAAIEDAGYTRDSLRARFPKAGSADAGVFVGVTTNSYNLWAPEERSRGNFVCPSAMPWSIANRVSYFFDLNGPSLPIDTACSSSLVAVHMACESLRRRECQIAIAGGVNLYLHPAKYQSLCQRRSLSIDGKCYSYGAGGDGFVPGEGVGTLVLKPLRKAIEDGDHIHAVIRSSAFDHSGRSNGYSAPNPNSQASVIGRTLEKAGIHPETIGYVEGHGTGTQLGDSLEIAALTQAFRRQTSNKQFCPIGSVKANIGHSESAAGIAGLMKVILQMEHRQLAPSIHSEEPNPNIEFSESPFYLQHELSEWASPDHPRRALINSFGAGGVNACVVVEEYETPQMSSSGRTESGPYLFVLSAKNEDRLREYVDRLTARLRNRPDVDLASLCYTLQAGREAMEERLATVISTVDELVDRLSAWRERGSAAGVVRGSAGPRRGSRRTAKLARAATGEHDLTELASKWTAGEDVDWAGLYSHTTPRRIALPTYPFARERYWVADAPVSEKPVLSGGQLHPLIACNSSTLSEISFSSSLSDLAFYATDHQVYDERIFPGAGFLEMACIAGNIGSERRVRKILDVGWNQPLSFRTGTQLLRTVLKSTANGVEYAISSLDDDNETVVHSEGRLALGSGRTVPADAGQRLSLQTLKSRCTEREDGASFYDKCSEYGLHYGPSFRTIQELYVNETFALSKLSIADHLKGAFGQYILHPSIIDGALQTVAGLAGSSAPQTLFIPFALDEVEIIGPVPQTCYAYAERADAQTPNRAASKFNIRLLNESGDVLVELKNLYVRPIARPLTSSRSLAAGPATQGRLLSLSRESFE